MSNLEANEILSFGHFECVPDTSILSADPLNLTSVSVQKYQLPDPGAISLNPDASDRLVFWELN